MENSFLRVKFSFREAIERKDNALLKTLMLNHVATMQIRRVVLDERFHGFTALQKACLDQNKDAASIIIEYGVDIEQRGKHGWSALHAAAFASKNDLSLITLLLNSCADVNARDDHGCLPVDVAEYTGVRGLLLEKMVEKGHVELAEMYKKIDSIKSQSNTAGIRIKISSIECVSDSKQIAEGTCSKIDESLGTGYFFNCCEKREQFLSDRPLLRRERVLGQRRVNSWNFRSKRDSGISVDEPDITFI